MAENNVKKFLDQQGTGYLWTKIAAELANKAAVSDVTALAGRVSALETAPGYDDTALANRVSTLEQEYDDAIDILDPVISAVHTLVDNDENKSVRTIANEELAARLIAADADEALDTLEEIAAWIQAHPGDAATMNAKITALEGKMVLGEGYNTVKAYVEGYVGNAVDNMHTHDNKAALDTITAALIANWNDAYTKAHEHTNKAVLDTITSEKVTAWDGAEAAAKAYADGLASNYATAAQGALADTAVQPADIVALTSAEIDAAIAAAQA